MARRQLRGGDATTRISLPNILSVGRQAANRRQIHEAESMDNTLVTLERNFEKRSGFTVVPQNTTADLYSSGWDFSSNNSKLDLFALSAVAGNDLWYYWYNINEETRFLIVVDFDATTKDSQLFYMYQLLTDGSWKNVSLATQWDPADTTIVNATIDDPNNSAVVQAYATAAQITYADAVALGTLTTKSRAYITYKTETKTARESLRAVVLGSNVVILNTNVSAGFSSNVDGKLFDLAGVVTTDDDIAGRKLTYFTAAKVIKVYDVGLDGSSNTPDDVFLGYAPDSVSGSYTNVNDYIYHKPGLAFLGQRVNDASVIRLPPEKDDWYGNNTNISNGDTKAQQMLSILYDTTHPLKTIIGGVGGRGKIYNTLNSFLNLSAGYYRVISFSESEIYGYGTTSITVTTIVIGNSYKINTLGNTTNAQWVAMGVTGTPAANITFTATNVGVGTGTVFNAVVGIGNPYLQKIRTPDEWSYIDPARMPQKISFNIVSSEPAWEVTAMVWKPRDSGTKDSNPGPSIFRTIDGKALKQVRIKSLSVFKDRLWFSADDVVFSSSLNDYENLFITDPTNIVDSDPIDIRASSNTYAEVVSMSPFEDYLFVNTKANIQFQLSAAGGEGTTLSPTNVSISPVAYYSTSTILEPQTIGSQLYFYDAKRLYLYMGKDKLGLSSAIEVSSSVSNYLPQNYKAVCTAPTHNSILCVDADNPNNIYFYTVRFSGERLIQSSFYRFVLNNVNNIQTLQAYNNYIYAVIKNNDKFFIERTNMIPDDVTIPRLDNVFVMTTKVGGINPNTIYDSSLNITTFKIPIDLPYTTASSRVVFGSTWAGEIPNTVTIGTVTDESTYKEFTIQGNYGVDNMLVYLGNSFTMSVELSPLYVRDVNNQVVEGTLSIRSGVTQHHGSGPYSINVSSHNRTPLISTFYPNYADIVLTEDSLPLDLVDMYGEFTFKVFGFSNSTTITISSDAITPVSIVNITFRGKFQQKSNSIDN